MDHILTLLCDPGKAILTPEIAEAARRALAGERGGVDWLADRVACEMPFAGMAPRAATAAARRALDGIPVDVVAQPRAGRRKRLLVADMDSTIITAETIDELATLAGVGDKVRAITERAMAGALDFSASLRARVALLEGLEEAALERVFRDAARLTPGARAMVRTMRAHGAHTVLVSGGFTYFTSRVATLAGFDANQGNRLEVDNGRLTGRIAEPIINRDSKQRALESLANDRGLALAETMAVGDGANDIGMLRVAGLGVAFRAGTAVAEQAAVRIDHGDLTALLYLQGYRESEILRDAR